MKAWESRQGRTVRPPQCPPLRATEQRRRQPTAVEVKVGWRL